MSDPLCDWCGQAEAVDGPFCSWDCAEFDQELRRAHAAAKKPNVADLSPSHRALIADAFTAKCSPDRRPGSAGRLDDWCADIEWQSLLWLLLEGGPPPPDVAALLEAG